MRKFGIILIIVLIAAIGLFVWNKNDTGTRAPSNTSNQVKQPQKAGFDTHKYSWDSPSSPWVVANKTRPLNPQNYTPSDLTVPDVALRLTANDEEMQLRQTAATALEELFADAGRAGYELLLASGYRSYTYQKGLYNHYVNVQGKAVADTQSARPGYSEHQTGLAVDIGPASRDCEVEECFAATPEGKWVAKNAHLHGFIIRYPKDKQSVTGYIYEPWHLRYVGKDLANEVFNAGNPPLETFLGLPAAPGYK